VFDRLKLSQKRGEYFCSWLKAPRPSLLIDLFLDRKKQFAGE
jgi:hypothetical protein